MKKIKKFPWAMNVSKESKLEVEKLEKRIVKLEKLLIKDGKLENE